MGTYPASQHNERKTAIVKLNPTYHTSNLDKDLLVEGDVDEGKEKIQQALEEVTLYGTLSTCVFDKGASFFLALLKKKSQTIVSKYVQFQCNK